jgi:hypothetical protein
VVKCKASSAGYPGESDFNIIEKIKFFSIYIKIYRVRIILTFPDGGTVF